MILVNAIILYVVTVVTNAETPYLRMILTLKLIVKVSNLPHLIELLYLDVKGAAIQASPNFYGGASS